MVLGDFNSVLKEEDRVGGNVVVWLEVEDFHNCVIASGLLEFPTQGPRYTWSDKHANQRNFFKN